MAEETPRVPEKINQAVMLLYLTLGIGAVRVVMEAPTAYSIFIFLFACGFMWFFIHMIRKGKNWARITFLVLFTLGLLLAIYPLLQSLRDYPVSGVLGIAQTVMQLVATIFLFQKPSSDWFREMNALRPAA